MLGLREGATQKAAVATGLLNDLVERGLSTDRPLLFLVDGAPASRRALRDLYGALGVVQRCQAHKYRHVLGHLPERLLANMGRALRTAWGLQSRGAGEAGPGATGPITGNRASGARRRSGRVLTVYFCTNRVGTQPAAVASLFGRQAGTGTVERQELTEPADATRLTSTDMYRILFYAQSI